ncbi:MAG TPA: phosphatase PAP2 family protein, partial [Jiangellaceae bacterium]
MADPWWRSPSLWAGIVLLTLAAALTVPMLVDPADPLFFDADTAWRDDMVGSRDEVATTLARFLAAVGTWPWAYLAVAAAVVALATGRGRRPALYVALCCVTTSIVTVPLLKLLVERARPPEPMVYAAGYSFPSGHAGIAAALTASLVLVATRWRAIWTVVAVIVTVAMMWSRTYLSVHWLSDTIAAALIGAGIAL